MEKIRVESQVAGGSLWFIMWMFTIGYLHLSFWQGVLAIVVWPYFIGAYLAPGI